jgi:hypothetical protein
MQQLQPQQVPMAPLHVPVQSSLSPLRPCHLYIPVTSTSLSPLHPCHRHIPVTGTPLSPLHPCHRRSHLPLAPLYMQHGRQAVAISSVCTHPCCSAAVTPPNTHKQSNKHQHILIRAPAAAHAGLLHTVRPTFYAGAFSALKCHSWARRPVGRKVAQASMYCYVHGACMHQRLLS